MNSKKLICITVTMIAFCLLCKTTGVYAITYNYAGQTYSGVEQISPPLGDYDSTMRVSGSMTFTMAIADTGGMYVTPDTWSFFDGRYTIDSTQAMLVKTFWVQVSAGVITDWEINLITPWSPSATSDPRVMHAIYTNGGYRSYCNDIALWKEYVNGTTYQDTGLQTSPITVGMGSWTNGDTPIPEPATAAMLFLGCIVLIGLRKKFTDS